MKAIDGCEECQGDFINASYIDVSYTVLMVHSSQCPHMQGYSCAVKFIAAQGVTNVVGLFRVVSRLVCFSGPMKHTVTDFWRLIWQEGPQCIVMVTKLMDCNVAKCERYWPTENKTEMYGPFKVTTLGKIILPDIVKRKLKVEVRSCADEIP